MQEKKIIELFKNKLIEEYGYSENDIISEQRIDVLHKNHINYTPDIAVYKKNIPHIIIELKTNYSHKNFSQIFEKVFTTSKVLKAPYFVLATNDYIEAYEIYNDKAVAIPNIPTIQDKYINKFSIDLKHTEVEHILNEIRDILWSGGKRDDYTIINEVNKFLLTKIYDDKNRIGLFDNQKNFYIHSSNQTQDKLNILFRNANDTYKIYDSNETLNTDMIEIEIIVRLLERLKLSTIENFEDIFYDIFVKPIKNEMLLSKDILQILTNIFYDDNGYKTMLCAGSGFGQLSLKNKFEDTIYSIENNKIKYQTHQILQIIKGYDEINYLDDYLYNNKLQNNSFDKIISIPPINIKSKNYPKYRIENRENKDLSALFIEQSNSYLEKDGVLYIVVTDSLLSNNIFNDTREYIKNNFNILAIVSLPMDSILNTNIKCSLLVLRKTKEIVDDTNILMFEITLNNDINYVEIITKHIKLPNNSKFTIKKEVLEHRWDYHYFKKEFLEIEKKVQLLNDGYLGDYVELIRGSDLGHNKFGTKNLIRAGNIKNGNINIDKLGKVTEEDYYKNERGITRENDLVINVVGKTPQCAKVTKELEGANTNSSVVIMRSKNNNIESINKIQKYLNSNFGQKLLQRAIIYTSNTPIITQLELSKIPIILTYDYDELLEDTETIKDLSTNTEEIFYQDEIIFEENVNINTILSFKGIKGKVFSLDVIRTFISLGDLKDFKTNKQKFQREVDEDHKNRLVDFLSNKNYKFFPEIVVGLKNVQVLKEKKLLTITKAKETVNLSLNAIENSQENIFDHIEVLDGRHRIESIKSYLENDVSKEKLTVSIVFILLEENDDSSLADRAIFYNLNAKAKHLLPDDYLNLLDSDDQDKLNELGILNITLFKFLSKNKDSIFENISDPRLVLKKCIYLTDYMVEQFGDEKLKDEKCQKHILKILQTVNKILSSSFDINLKTKLYKIVIFILANHNIQLQFMHKYLLKELEGFIEWLKVTNLIENLKQVHDLKDFFQTYQKTYIPKSKKIYISMPYHKETERTYFLIKDVINDISNNLNIKIEAIRTDQEADGVHSGIREKVYSQIEDSDLMIADLTGNNPNVFNEVGFKMGLDKASGLKDTQIIFIFNSQSYYKEMLDIKRISKTQDPDAFEVDGKVFLNESRNVAFNLSSIKQITFYDSYYLKAQLYKELEQYFRYYKITKVSK
ncbi:MAG: hypothetical protein GQ474_01300 [Sulfurimonas sp.]|nr:hypothetical protein [Sulfurimonas sp.]